MSQAVLITGASSGLGLEIALYLAEHGFDVYAGLRDPGRSGPLRAEAARRGVSVCAVPLDVTRGDQIGAAVERILERSGAIYGLVNNAGYAAKGFFEDLSEDEIRESFEVNVFGTMAVTRAVLPAMRTVRSGRVVLITSSAGLVGSPAYSAYCAAKFCLEGFGESLHAELVPFNIPVTLVEPSFIRTGLWDPAHGRAAKALDPDSPYSHWYERLEQVTQRMVNRSPVRPEDVARTVHRALVSPRPALRYVVGWRPRLVLGLLRHVPGQGLRRTYLRGLVRRITSSPAPRIGTG